MKVLMLLKTTGLQYDDRVRKECKSLRSLGAEPVVAVLEDGNAPGVGRTEYGVRYRAIALASRRVFRQAQGLPVKTSEMYSRFLPIILREKPDVLWLHNIEMMGMVPVACAMRSLGVVGRVVWDQHELPPGMVLNNKGIRRMFRLLVKGCDAVVTANQERLQYLRERLGSEGVRKFHVIENFPDREFAQLPKGRVPGRVEEWLRGVPFFLTQGGADSDRHLKECVEAVIALDGQAKLVVVGRYSARQVEELQQRWGRQLDHTVLFTGMVPQMQMVSYIDNALASIVLYSSETPNSWFCASNRLYQAIARGTPVIAGANPPLRTFVHRTGAGVALSTSGSDVGDIVDAMNEILKRRETFAARAVENAFVNIWDTQIQVISNLIGNATFPSDGRLNPG